MTSVQANTASNRNDAEGAGRCTRVRIAWPAALFLAALLVAAGCSPAHQATVPHVQGSETSYVTRHGARLVLDGKAFRFGGANIYWLGLDQNVGGVAYPTDFRIRDALETAKDMGATVVRSHTLGTSTGNRLSLEPSLGTFNPGAFHTIDYAIHEAKAFGLRLIVPLTDNWNYYHGGTHNFTDWLHLPKSAFHSSPLAMSAFKAYIAHLLQHVNPLTGLALDDDPTIMAFELGNELNGMTTAWVDSIAGFIRRLAPHQLIAAGAQAGVSSAALASPYVDIVDCHFYFPFADAADIASQAAQVTKAGKVFIAGEYASTAASPSLFASLVANGDVSGAAFWSLFAHNDSFGYVTHNDGYTVHSPGVSAGMHLLDGYIRDFDLAMSLPGPAASRRAVAMVRGVGAPPEPPPGRPLITSVKGSGSAEVIAFRGSTDAYDYSVLVATSGPNGPWRVICDRCVNDDTTPWTGMLGSPGDAWVKIVPYNDDGVHGAASAAVKVRGIPGGGVRGGGQ